MPACAGPSRSARRSSCPSAVVAVLSERTRWVAVTAARQRGRHRARPRGIVAAAHAAARASTSTRCTRRRTGQRPGGTRRRHGRLLGVQVVRAARRRPVRAAGAPRRAHAGQARTRRLPTAPDRWELGTLPFEALAGVTAAAEYMLEVGYERSARTRTRCWQPRGTGSAAIDGVTLYGDAPDRAPTLMFNVAGYSARRSRPRWPRVRWRCGTATTTPGSWSASWPGARRSGTRGLRALQRCLRRPEADRGRSRRGFRRPGWDDREQRESARLKTRRCRVRTTVDCSRSASPGRSLCPPGRCATPTTPPMVVRGLPGHRCGRGRARAEDDWTSPRRPTFSCDIAYSDSPAATRTSPGSPALHTRVTMAFSS